MCKLYRVLLVFYNMSSIAYEKYTVRKMIQLYCRKKHSSAGNELCSDCDAVNNYAQQRLDNCPFGDDKGACEACAIHCYKKDMREKIREIMRFSGPRMLIYHPFDFIIHYVKDKGRRATRRKDRK